MENKNLRLRMITSEKKITEAFSNSSGLKINKTLKQQLQTPHYMTPINNRVYTKTGTHKIKPKINQAVAQHTSSSPQLTRSATPIPKKTRDTINCNLKKNNSYIPKTLKDNHHTIKGRSLTPIRFPTQTVYGRNRSAKSPNLLKDSADTSNFNNFQGKKNELQIILSLKRKIKRQNELLEKKEKEIENLTNGNNNARLNELAIENGVFQKELQKMKELIKQKDQTDFNNPHQNNIYNNNETSTIEEKVKDDIKTLQINMNDITVKYHNEIEKNKKLEQNYVNLNQDYIRLKNDLEQKLKEIEELKKSNNENKESELECISLDEDKLKAVTEENKELSIKIEKLNDVINHLNEVHQEAVRENANLKEEQIKIKNYYDISLMSVIEIDGISLILPILFNKLKIEKNKIETAFNDNQEIKEISNELCNILSINKQEVNYIERYLLNLFQQNNNDLNRVKDSFIEIITKELNVSETISEKITTNIKQLIQKCETFDLLSTKTISICSLKKIFDFVYQSLSPNEFSELLNYSITHNNDGNYSLSYIPYEHFYLLDSTLDTGNRDDEIVPRNDTNLIISDVVEHKLVIEESDGEIEKKDKNLLEGKKENKDNTNENINVEIKDSLENETKLNKNTKEFDLLNEEEKKENLVSKEENKEQQKEIKEETKENDNKEKIIVGGSVEEGEENNNEVKIKTEKQEENIEKTQKNEGNNNEKKENESNKEDAKGEKQDEKDLINEEEKNKEILQEKRKEENKENSKEEIKENINIEEKKEENIEDKQQKQEEKKNENKVEIKKEEPVIIDKVNQAEKEDNPIEKEAKTPITFEEMKNLIKQHLERNNQTINDFLSSVSENDYCLIDNEKYIPIEIFISKFGILEIFNTKIISNESFEPSILSEKKDKINYKLFTSFFLPQKDKEITQESNSQVEGGNKEKEKEENPQKDELHQITKEYVTELFNNVIGIIKEKSNSYNESQKKIPPLKEEKNEEENKNIV